MIQTDFDNKKELLLWRKFQVLLFIYFGPMGCRTGNYLILGGDYESRDIVELVTGMFEFIRDFEGEISGAAARDCGNYLDQNLPMAKWQAKNILIPACTASKKKTWFIRSKSCEKQTAFGLPCEHRSGKNIT